MSSFGPEAVQAVKLCPVVGAHGTGKSTLLRRLGDSPLGSRIPIGKEIPRLIGDAAGRNDFYQRGQNTLAKQIHLLFEQLATEMEYERSCDPVVVLDRSLLDHFAYTQVLFGQELAETRLGKIVDDRLTKLVPRYAKVFYIPIEVPLVGDGMREDDREFQCVMDRAIVGLLGKHYPNFVTLTGSVETRFATLAQHLNSL